MHKPVIELLLVISRFLQGCEIHSFFGSRIIGPMTMRELIAQLETEPCCANGVRVLRFEAFSLKCFHHERIRDIDTCGFA